MRYPLILACVSGAALIVAPPALGQGKKDRAREAVAAAQAKVDRLFERWSELESKLTR